MKSVGTEDYINASYIDVSFFVYSTKNENDNFRATIVQKLTSLASHPNSPPSKTFGG